ncbi:MFS transporter [Pseudomonas monteilii]|uniref:MFS transporter n=1 Tax=Pseudomonas monteilii TaxID=76759 RepID=UPI00383B0F74
MSENYRTTAGYPIPTGVTKGILMLCGSMTIMGSVMVAPVIPKIIQHFAEAESAALLVQLAITGPALAISLFSPLAGLLADRLGRKRLLMLATLCYALLGAAPYLVQQLPSLVGARVMFGVAEAVVMTCCMTLIGDYWHDQQRLGVINLQVITIGLVGTLLYLVGGWIGQDSWRNPFLLYLIPLLLIPLMAKYLFEPPRSAAGSGRPTMPGHTVAWKPLFAGYSAIFFGMVLAFVVPIQSPFLLMSIGVSSTLEFAALSGWSLFISLAGSLLWPTLHRRLGIAATNGVTFMLFGCSIFFMCHAGSYAQMLIAVTFHGIACGLFPPNAMAPVMAALPDRARARGMGCFTSLLYLGQFLSPVLVAVLMPASAELRFALHVIALMALIYALTWFVAVATRRNGAAASPHSNH